MRRLPRGEEIRVSSARLRYRLVVWFLFLSTMGLSLLSSALHFFFIVLFSPQNVYASRPLMPFSLLLSHDLLPSFQQQLDETKEKDCNPILIRGKRGGLIQKLSKLKRVGRRSDGGPGCWIRSYVWRRRVDDTGDSKCRLNMYVCMWESECKVLELTFAEGVGK